jgi:hypothetical protein
MGRKTLDTYACSAKVSLLHAFSLSKACISKSEKISDLDAFATREGVLQQHRHAGKFSLDEEGDFGTPKMFTTPSAPSVCLFETMMTCSRL